MILFHATDRNRRQTSKLQFAFCAAESEQQEETANCCAVAVCVPCREVLRTHFQLSYSLVVELLGHASVALIPCTPTTLSLGDRQASGLRVVVCIAVRRPKGLGSEEPATRPEKSPKYFWCAQCRNRRHSKCVSGG